jgi:hypothetical protein
MSYDDDVFIVQNSPLDSGTFNGFGFGWYQSDMESGSTGDARVVMKGIFDQETFIEDPASAFSPVRTFNVGFWFNSPTVEKDVCGNSSAPAKTPFNGQQDAGLLAMITQGGPLRLVADSAPAAGVNSPAHGAIRAGKAVTFVTTCSDPHGWKNIHTIDLEFAKGVNRGHSVPLALWVRYDQNADLIRFFDPSTRRWSQGKPGSNKTLSSKYASINLARSLAKGLGPKSTTVKVSWQIVFKSPAIAASYHQMLRIVDDFGVTRGWHTAGSWSVQASRAAAELAAQVPPAPAAIHSPLLRHADATCSSSSCTFSLGLNPGLAAGKPFACPAIQHARASITVSNRFRDNSQNDVMTLEASGLPPSTGFDVFLVQNSPLDSGAFAGFGFGWYQSDMSSDGSGNASVTMQGIFDHEVFIENPSNAFSPIHTFNVGFWFGDPTSEQSVCGNSSAPAKTPFNGQQNAGLLAMITSGEPLGTIF